MNDIVHTPDAPTEYTTVGGRPRTGRHGQRRSTRPAGRDLLVRGLLLPYGVILDDGQHGREVYSFDTNWEGERWLPLTINHSALIGQAEVFEDRLGLHIEGRISYPFRRMAQGKTWLSAKFESIESHHGRGGVVEHVACRLVDASITDRPVARPYTYATFTEAAA